MIQSTPTLRVMVPGGMALLASLATTSVAVSRPLRVMAPAIAALFATVVLRRGDRAMREALRAAHERVAAAEAANGALLKAAAQMRHDLRGILSPALLTADRLTLSKDPVARRAGEAMVSTVDRAVERLRREP